jgi:hypothetical protein
MPMSDDVEKCERTISELEAKRQACVARGVALADERSAIALEACTGDAKAGKRLEQIHSGLVTQASELAAFDAALKAAASHLAAAQQAEARAQDRINALALREELQAFCTHGMKIDDALAVIVEASAALRESLTKIHSLGSAFPSHDQLDVLGKACVLTALRQTPWDRHFDVVPPNQRRNFTGLCMQWHDTIERDLARRLGENEEAAA